MAERSSYRIPVHLKLTYAENGTYHAGVTENMSESGMFVISNYNEVKRSNLVTIELPVKNTTITLSGKMVRSMSINSNKSGFGVSLDNPPRQYLEYIEELLLAL